MAQHPRNACCHTISIRLALQRTPAPVAGVCKACFSSEHMVRHGRLMSEYRDSFVRDLDPASPGWPASLGDLSGRLKAWRATLQSTVEDSMPPYLRLEDEARQLQVRMPCMQVPWGPAAACLRFLMPPLYLRPLS